MKHSVILKISQNQWVCENCPFTSRSDWDASKHAQENSETEKAPHRCAACEGHGWLLVNVDGAVAPPAMAFIQKCDECGRFADDHLAALQYSRDTGKPLLGVLARAE